MPGVRSRARDGSPTSSSALALGTVVRGSLGDLHGLDRRAAPPARKAGAPVHLQLRAELAGLAEEVHVGVIVQRGTARLDRFLQGLLDPAVEPADLLR